MSKKIFYTHINGGPGLVSPTAKTAVSKGLSFAKAGQSVEFTESTANGEIVKSEEAHRILNERLNPAEKTANVGSVELHNALEELGMFSRELARNALKRGLKEEEQARINTLIEQAQLYVNA